MLSASQYAQFYGCLRDEGYDVGDMFRKWVIGNANESMMQEAGDQGQDKGKDRNVRVRKLRKYFQCVGGYMQDIGNNGKFAYDSLLK